MFKLPIFSAIFIILILSISVIKVCDAEELTILTKNIDSKALNENRSVLIGLPASYQETNKKRYPVLYTLNDEDNFKWANYITNLLASRYAIEEMIVVGLPHSGNYSKDNYPFKGKGSFELNEQAQRYSSFIREEAIPYVDKYYRTKDSRFIVGHSLSGLFVTHLFIQYPDAFSTFVALSPSLHHAPQMINVMNDYLTKHPKLAGQVFMSIGALEHEQIQQGYSQMRGVFTSKAHGSLNWQMQKMENNDHMLAAFRGTYDALAWIYSDYTISSEKAQQMSYQDIIDHYGELSKRLHYTIKPREQQIFGLGQFLVKKIKNIKAGVTVLKVAAYYYPDSEKIRKLLSELKG